MLVLAQDQKFRTHRLQHTIDVFICIANRATDVQMKNEKTEIGRIVLEWTGEAAVFICYPNTYVEQTIYGPKENFRQHAFITIPTHTL